MGGDLPAAKSKAPSFIVWAESNPTSANLDRIQIVKGWAKNGQSFEKVYDVAWSGNRKPDSVTGKVPAIRNTVDISKGTYQNTTGSKELKTVWTDPDFESTLKRDLHWLFAKRGPPWTPSARTAIRLPVSWHLNTWATAVT